MGDTRQERAERYRLANQADLERRLRERPGHVICPQCEGEGSWPPLTRQCCPMCHCHGTVLQHALPLEGAAD